MKKVNNSCIDGIDKRAYEIVDDLGIPSHILGYDYIAYAVQVAGEDPSMINGMTKYLYPKVAEYFETTSSKVERAIRHASDIAFRDISDDIVHKYFGNSLKSDTPTNGHLVSSLAREYRRVVMKE